MVKFSQELSWMVRPYNKFGSHLSLKGETIDPVLEKKNFMHASQILAEIWSGMIITQSWPNTSIKRRRKKY